MQAVEVVAELSRVFPTGDWQAMRALYHPSALILTVTGGPTPLTADAVIAQLAQVSEDFVYSVSASDPVPLDEHAAIVTGRMRRRLPGGGFEDASHLWLLTVRDDLVYRQGVFSDQPAAVEAYERLGITLGLGDI